MGGMAQGHGGLHMAVLRWKKLLLYRAMYCLCHLRLRSECSRLMFANACSFAVSKYCRS